MTNLIGKSLGRYHILKQLGEGGMATVYKAYDTSIERDVAIKVIRSDQFVGGFEKQTLTRFKREAKALAKLNHPNIVTVYDFGQFEDLPYLVMEYMPGGTLKEKLSTMLPWRKAFKLLLPIIEALGFAHSQGVLHRDVKPSNILITPSGEPLLSDFGIAKILDVTEGNTITLAGVGVGTPEYMAPEQGIGKKVDSRVDIYSLGVVLYEAITGKKPYSADTPLAILFKHANEPLPRPKSILPELPLEVEEILIKLLAKNPANRFQTMELLAAAMQQLLGVDLPDDAEFAPEISPGGQSKQVGSGRLALRGWLYALAGGLIILLVIASLLFKPLVASNLRSDDGTANVINLPEKTSTPLIIPSETIAPPNVTPTITPTPIGGAEQVVLLMNDSNQVNIQSVSGSAQMQSELLDSSSSGGSSLWSSPDFKKVAWESSSGLKIYDSKTKSSQSFSVQRINNMVWHDDLENITFETFDGSKDSEVITLNLKTGELTNYSSCMAIGTHLYLQSVSPDGETIIVLEYTPDGNQLSEKLILVSRDCQGIHELYNINRPAKYTVELGQLLKRESVFQGVSWSSNSQQFVVSLSGNLFILDKTGENKSALAGWTTERAISPMWLPDSDLVYYLTDDSLIVINTDTIEKEIIGTLHQPQDIILSPNMEYFLIPTTDADRREALWTHQHLWIYKVKDNELIHLTDVLSSNQNGSIPRDMLRGFVSNPSWSPDGKWVGYLSDDKAELINIEEMSFFTATGNPYSGFLGYDPVWLK